MVPRVSTPGQSFQGAGLYYLHDKDAVTSQRIAFTQVENIPGVQDPQKALGWMAYTALGAEQLKRENGGSGTGRRAEKPVWTASFSWAPEQRPTPEHMVSVARSWLETRGLKEHQAVMVAHNDEAYAHIHVIVNLIHPTTGLLNKKALSHTHLLSSKWAEAYERQQGGIVCPQRVENNARREKGEFVRYQEPELDMRTHVTQLYHASDSGKAFQAALQDAGYSLAQGKRIVLLDRDGTIHSLSRQIEGVSAKDIRAKLGDVELPDVDEARERQGRQSAGNKEQEAGAKAEAIQSEEPASKKEPEPIFVDRDEQERAWQDAVIDAAIQYRPAQRVEGSAVDRINAMQARHHAELGQLYADNQQARDKLAEELGQQYGDHERQLRKDIARLEGSLKRPGRIQKFLSSVTGRHARQVEELAGLRRGLESIECRKIEARQGLENRINEQAETVRVRQSMERRVFEPQPEAERERESKLVTEILDQERNALGRDENSRGFQRQEPNF